MNCKRIPGGFACGGRAPVRRCSTPLCGRPSEFECDFPVHRRKPGASQTCDARMCAKCRRAQSEGVDFCPPHDDHAKKVAAR